MKKLVVFLFFLFPIINIFSQDTIRIKHKNYETVFSKSKKYPVLVEWWVTRKMISCKTPLERKDNFKPDPKLPEETNIAEDYVASGFDRGHMMPADDNLCQSQQIQDECFYFSNIAPQYHTLNNGDWKSLENWTKERSKKVDSIKVWCGNVGEIKKIGVVSVPKYCWKVLYFKRENIWMYFLFDNDQSKPDGLKNNEVDADIIKEVTGFKFKKP